MRFLPVGPRTFLAELEDLDQTLALFDALLADPVPGVAEIIPAARTLMIALPPAFLPMVGWPAQFWRASPPPARRPMRAPAKRSSCP
ncbi:carboxyltransferase domain-containing protein [Paracoccus kondratievae]